MYCIIILSSSQIIGGEHTQGGGTFAGIKTHISKNGKSYADIFIFPLMKNGIPDMEQLKFRTFDPEVIASCKILKPGQQIIIDLEIREAFISGVELYEEN